MELPAQVDLQDHLEIKGFLVLLVPKVIRENEVMCNLKLLYVPLQDKCVNRSSRAIYPVITPS